MANDIKFGTKAIIDMLYGNKHVKELYYGNKLIWPSKRLLFSNNELIGIEYKPDRDITLNSVSIFQNDNISSGWTWICHESGFCVARQTSNGIASDTELYGLTGTLKTISSLGSITLYEGQNYYIFYKRDQWDNNSVGTQFAYYDGETGNYKVGKIDGYMTVSNKGETIDDVFYLYTDQTVFPYKGTFGIDQTDSTAVKNFLISKNLTKHSTFTWNGNYCSEPSLDGPNNLKSYVVNTNLTNLITITQSDLDNYNTAVQKYAYVLYRAGTNIGRCIRYMPTNSIQWEGTDIFGGPDKLYEITWPMDHNKITSMTPVTQEPSQPQTYDMYYKASGANWGGITDEAVVIYLNDNWQKATNWTACFTKYEWGNQGIIKRITTDYLEYNILNLPTTSGNKRYLRINGNEV